MENYTKRITRLTTILTQLQSKKLLTASELANKFEVSTRTIYRDLKVLEQAGVPILTEEGKGYSLIDGYRIPPIMFSESEANALITAEKLVLKNKDASFANEYSEAISKIKSVVRYSTREKLDFLAKRVSVIQNNSNNHSSNFISILQLAITNFNCIELIYKNEQGESSKRIIEPFALYNTQENWVLVAFCQIRNDMRAFRLDRIQKLTSLNREFQPHKITLQEYFENCKKK